MIGEHYIPGLGIVELSRNGRMMEVQVHQEDFEAVAKPIERMSFCGGCDKEDQHCLQGDYICVECRESQGDITFDADLQSYTGGTFIEGVDLRRNPRQMALDTP